MSGGEESDGEGEEREAEEMEENEFMEAEQRRFDAQLPMLVLPLYSLLSAEQQARVYGHMANSMHYAWWLFPCMREIMPLDWCN